MQSQRASLLPPALQQSMAACGCSDLRPQYTSIPTPAKIDVCWCGKPNDCRIRYRYPPPVSANNVADSIIDYLGSTTISRAVTINRTQQIAAVPSTTMTIVSLLFLSCSRLWDSHVSRCWRVSCSVSFSRTWRQMCIFFFRSFVQQSRRLTTVLLVDNILLVFTSFVGKWVNNIGVICHVNSCVTFLAVAYVYNGSLHTNLAAVSNAMALSIGMSAMQIRWGMDLSLISD